MRSLSGSWERSATYTPVRNSRIIW
jgi:hypothetical protein